MGLGAAGKLQGPEKNGRETAHWSQLDAVGTHQVLHIAQPGGQARCPWPSNLQGAGGFCAPLRLPACGRASGAGIIRSEPPTAGPAPLMLMGGGSTPRWATGPFIKWGRWSSRGVFTLGGLALRS